MMEKNSSFKTLFSYKTDLNADSVEWCPHEPNQNVFVCGNYELTQQNVKESERVGKILLFTLSNKHGLKLHQTVKTAGILDQKWCHSKVNNQSVLGIATANGQIVIYTLNHSGEFSLKLMCICTVTSPDILLLSLDWSTAIFKSNEINIICSDSRGSIHLLKLGETQCELMGSWKGHISSWGACEAWVAGFNYWNTNIFFSGGDDGAFLMYDRRIEGQFVEKNKCHLAGVTSLHSNPLKEHILVSGSYDQHIRIWDIRNIKQESHKIQMPGEVWRVKWDPFRGFFLLAACMYKGVHVVNFQSVSEGKVVGSYYEHNNISYGVDWSYLKQNNSPSVLEDEYIIGSCSFYDNLLCISKFYNKNITFFN